MKYYKAVERESKPFIGFSMWATSFEELTEMGEAANPLIIAENLIDYQYGVCTKKIVDGALVDRTISEMVAFAEEDEIYTIQRSQRLQSLALNAGTFTYDGKVFSMNDTARLFYQTIDKIRGNVKVLTTSGTLYSLMEPNIDAFLLQYYTQVQNLTKPTE